jgi:hypothetical protein
LKANSYGDSWCKEEKEWILFVDQRGEYRVYSTKNGRLVATVTLQKQIAL